MSDAVFDLEAFLTRVGLELERDSIVADLASLGKLTSAMTASCPFEQLDPALGRGVDSSLPAVFEKVVRRGRGGYCFELNGLMTAALRALGFECQQRAARVVLGPEPSGFTHLVNLVSIAGAEYLVDVGFGRDSLRAPLPLSSLLEGDWRLPGEEGGGLAGAPVLMYPDAYRLVEDCGRSYLFPGALRLESFSPRAWCDAGEPTSGCEAAQRCWRSLYAFHPEQPVAWHDIKVGNYYVATRLEADNWFTNTRLAILLTPEGRKILQAGSLIRERRTSCRDLRALFPHAHLPADGGAESALSQDAALIERDSEMVSESVWLDTLQSEFGLDLRWDFRSTLETCISLESFLPSARSNQKVMF